MPVTDTSTPRWSDAEASAGTILERRTEIERSRVELDEARAEVLGDWSESGGMLDALRSAMVGHHVEAAKVGDVVLTAGEVGLHRWQAGWMAWRPGAVAAAADDHKLAEAWFEVALLHLGERIERHAEVMAALDRWEAELGKGEAAIEWATEWEAEWGDPARAEEWNARAEASDILNAAMKKQYGRGF